jgi:hypothetical protein
MYGLYPEPSIDDPAGDVREQVTHGDVAPADAKRRYIAADSVAELPTAPPS